jgi:hypothetical protein
VSTETRSTVPTASDRPRAATLVAAALGFVLLYFSTDFVVPNVASSALPLPDAPVDEARAWFAENPLAATLVALTQFASVSCLAVFVGAWRRTVDTPRRRQVARWGLAAVAAMMLSSVFGWLLAALASTASLDTVEVLRTGNFIAGGTAHVLLLGVFVLAASRGTHATRPVRALAWIAVAPAVLSLTSLVWFEGAAFILLGRLLCMAWTVTAAISLARRGRSRPDGGSR